MEPFAHNKDEGAKKIIVATSNSSNSVLRARSSKSSGSPRHAKSRAAKTYSGTHNADSNTMNLSWPSLGHELSPENASPEKSPLGLYRSGSSFENSHPGIPDSSRFPSDSSVAAFNATLFSSAGSHNHQDVEEAMDIDHQDINDEAACASNTCSSVSELPEGIVSTHEQPRTSEEKKRPEEYAAGGKSNNNDSSTKPKVIKLLLLW